MNNLAKVEKQDLTKTGRCEVQSIIWDQIIPQDSTQWVKNLLHYYVNEDVILGGDKGFRAY